MIGELIANGRLLVSLFDPDWQLFQFSRDLFLFLSLGGGGGGCLCVLFSVCFLFVCVFLLLLLFSFLFFPRTFFYWLYCNIPIAGVLFTVFRC